MSTILLSVPSGSHSRALLKPLRPLFSQAIQAQKISLVVVSPMSPYPQLTEEFKGSGFQFVTWQPDVFAKFKPSLVVTTTTGLDLLDPPILKMAQRKNIPTLTYVESWDNIWKMERRKNEMVKVDTLLVWNQMMKNHVQRIFDYQDEQIHLVGSPRLDYFWDKEQIPSREKLCQHLGVDPQKKLIHIATVELYDISYVVKTIASARDRKTIKFPVEIYCSVHPGGNIKKHKGYAQKYKVKLRYSFGRKDKAPHPLFRYNPSAEEMYMLTALWIHADIMINFSSTAAIESMLGDTPTINVMYGKPWDLWHWRKSAVYRDFKEHYKDIIAEQGTTVVQNKKQLLAAVNQYLKRPYCNRQARKRTCYKMLTFLDGRSRERVFQKIMERAKV